MFLIIWSFYFWEGDDEIVWVFVKNFLDDVECGDYLSVGLIFDVFFVDILIREVV